MLNELISSHAWFLYCLIGAFSLAVGSLLNVVIYRLPLMLRATWRADCCDFLGIDNEEQRSRLNLFLPRSFCPHCKTPIKAWHNIPVLAYLWLRGRCPACRSNISIRYPLIESLTFVLSLYACYHFGLVLALPFALLAIWILICLFFIDMDYQLLPDSLTLGLLWIGLIANTQGLFAPLNEAVISAALAYLFLWLFVQIYYLVTGKTGMAPGDFKLFAAIGAWFGWPFLPMVLVISSLSGAVFGIVYLSATKKSKNTPIPFGPFLAIAALIVLFWGKNLSLLYGVA